MNMERSSPDHSPGKRWVGRVVKLAVEIVVIPVALYWPAHGQVVTNPRPLWRARVVSERNATERKSPFSRQTQSAGISFLDDERLVVHQIESTLVLSSRQDEEQSAFRLYVSVYDARSGKSVASRDWGTRLHGSALYVVSGGFLMKSGSLLRLMSNEFEQVRQVELGPESEGRTWDVAVSATGRTILTTRSDKTSSSFKTFSADSLEANTKWSEPAPFHALYSISDTAIVAADRKQRHIITSSFGTGTWNLVDREFGCVGIPVATADLLVNGACNRLSVLSLDGNVLMEDQTEKGVSVEQEVVLSRNGKFIAVSLARGRRSGHWLDPDVSRSTTRVAVYDLSARKRIFVVDVAPMPGAGYEYALSPTGSKLAVLSNGSVSVYSVSGSR